MDDEKILKEARKNSNLKRFIQFDLDENKKTQNNNENSSNYSEINENDKIEINNRFHELRKKHTNLNVDAEAEEHIQKLRDMGEYNRWSLKLIQKWLFIF